jgi:TPR repeat protein
MLERAEGTPQDITQAVTWYRLAAQKSNATAAMNLALILDFGKGVPANHAVSPCR